MHVGAGVDYLAKHGHSEFPFVAALPGDFAQAEVGDPPVGADAQAGKLLIGEVVAGVALRTFSGPLENVQAAPGARSQRALVPIQEAVIGRVARKDRPLKRGDGLGNAIEGNLAVSEGFLEQPCITRDTRYRGSRRRWWYTHLVRS